MTDELWIDDHDSDSQNIMIIMTVATHVAKKGLMIKKYESLENLFILLFSMMPKERIILFGDHEKLTFLFIMREVLHHKIFVDRISTNVM